MCLTHGGAAIQVREAAQRRLEQMVLPALAALRRLIDEADSDSVRIAAIRDILDRTGYKQPIEVRAEQEMTIRVVRVEQPILAYPYERDTHANGHGSLPPADSLR